MVFQNDILAGASGTAAGYAIGQSARFNDGDSPELSRTYSISSPWTFSAWVKRGELGSENLILGASGGEIHFNSDDTLEAEGTSSSAVFRDPAGWYHIHVSDNGLYVNGVSHGSVTTTSLSNQKLFDDFDGYVAEVHLQSGTSAYTNFGETNDDGVWIPKSASSGDTYLTFADSSDFGSNSGSGGDWTASGLTSADQVSDSPTLNFPVISPIDYQTGSNVTISDGNLTFQNANSGSANDARATFAVSSGKWYWEVEADALGQSGVGREFIGVVSPEWRLGTGSAGSNFSQDSTGYAYNTVGQKINNGSASSYGSSLSAGDIVGVALDLDNGKIWWSVNGTFQASGDPAAGTNEAYSGLSGTFAPAFAVDYGVATSRLIANFGQTGGLTYTLPTGFSQINSITLPEPTIKDGSAYFQASLYTGNGTAIGSGGKSVTQDKNSTFQPDFVWIKERNGAADNALYDVVRGTTKDLASNNSNAETTETEGLTAFNAAGFTVGNLAKVNTSSDTYVAWQWLAANGTSSNTVGSITSTISENTTSGLSIVTYTGDGNDNATVGHGLGVTPKTVVIFPRSNGDNRQVSNWETGVTAFTEDLKINAAEAANSSSSRVKGGSSTTFTLGTDPNVNGSGNTYLAYVWNEVAGFSKFATYTSNGSTNGPFVYCGFRPAVVFIRCTENGEYWHLYDSTRNTFNASNRYLFPSLGDAEGTSGRDIDILSNGFKLRGTDGGINSASNRKYIAMCFAENPFGGNGVAPATAR
jgi:hypothetical protein